MAIRNLPHLGGFSSQVYMEQAIAATLVGAFPPRAETANVNTTRVVILLTSGGLSAVKSGLNAQPTTSVTGTIYGPFMQPASAGRTTNKLTKPAVARLEELGRKLRTQVDYVFSIGLKGAYAPGVRALSKKSKQVLLLDQSQGYETLTVNALDPTKVICPIPVSDRCEQSGKSRPDHSSMTTNAIKPTFWYGSPLPYSPLFPGFFPMNPPEPPREPFLNLAGSIYRDEEEEQRLLLRRRVERLLNKLIHPQNDDNLYAVNAKMKDAGQFIPVIIVPQNVFQQLAQTRTFTQPSVATNTPYVPMLRSISLSWKPWELFSIRHKSGQNTSAPQMKSTEIDEDNWTVTSKAPRDGNPSNMQKVDENSMLLLMMPLNHSSDELMNTQPPTSQNSFFNPGNQTDNRTKNTKHVDVRRVQNKTERALTIPLLESILTSLKEYANARKENPPFTSPEVHRKRTKQDSVDVINRQLSSVWQDAALHEGAVLMFSMRAHSNHHLAELYSGSNKPIVSESHDWFRHADFDRWTIGLYRRVQLELWKAEQPVVRLTFNGEHADRYTWFQKSLLVEAYPWNERELLHQTMFLRSRNEPFSILRMPGSTSQSSNVSKTPTCPRLQADARQKSNNPTTFPIFLYGLPSVLWNREHTEFENSSPKFADYIGIHRADELRIYTVPYSLIVSRQNHTTIRAYTLLFALDKSLGISFSRLWHQNICSPPSYQPLHLNVRKGSLELVVPPCACWYRSRAIESWHRPSHIPTWFPGTTILTGFKRMRVLLSDDQGKLVGHLVFDTRGAHPDTWFTPIRLRASWPWSVQTLSTYNFVQFGRATYLMQAYPLSSRWAPIGLWIGLYGIGENDCGSVLIVLDKPTTSTMLPLCLFNATDRSVSHMTQMLVSKTPASVNRMLSFRQITIWSE
ncbi:hypothetical protein EG68_08906 [Paragonimus skrjabini miyazakii]|uniref:Uncharacterized protein n=1 Tax=Paragonimus skrjabini miyazakii TaxID=59628 RepID=A0A8S9YP45_9TREM|nr:hypothetical protein EG68_08906 [Paragonimus skrjabini miyazakii]